MKIFKADIEEIKIRLNDKKIPLYKKILVNEYWKLPDDKFTDTVNETIEVVKNTRIELFDIVKLYEYMQIMKILFL